MATETARHPNIEKTEECQSEATRCNKKMLKFMRFSLSIEDTELGAIREPSHPQPERKEKDIEDDCFLDEDVLRSLANMSLNLMIDQDSDADNPFCNLDRQFSESEIMPETADIAYISAQIWKVINEQKNLFLKTLNGCKYVASKQNEICLEDTMSAKITIFHGTFGMVTSNQLGAPVVLNFTGTDNFLCCTSQREDKILTIKTYDREKIHNSTDDPEKSSLIFYMSQSFDGLWYFESALHSGWFIHTVNDDVVKMEKGNNTSSSCFVLERRETTKPTEY